MVDDKVLAKRGCSTEDLRRIFTATGLNEDESTEAARFQQELPEDAPEKDRQRNTHRRLLVNRRTDHAIRKKIEEQLESEIQEGICRMLRTWRLYAAADLMHDGSPLTENVPLLLYAAGKIDKSACAKEMKALPRGAQFVTEEQGNIEINLSDFFATIPHIGKSFLKRRIAAQVNKYANLHPHYKYTTRGTSPAAKLRGEVASQETDKMAQDFGWSAHEEQCIHGMFHHNWAVDFVRSSWEKEEQEISRDVPADTETGELQTESIITKEGICWVKPHPSRVYWDISQPLTGLNSGTGPEWIGYWDVRRLGQLQNDTAYYNTGELSNSTGTLVPSWILGFQDYFNAYNTTIDIRKDEGNNLAAGNDRIAHIGQEASMEEDMPVVVVEHFKRMVPKDWGIGEYTHPVWIRFVCQPTGTIHFAEVMPSNPAAVYTYYRDDWRLENASDAHAMMGFQDIVTTLFNGMVRSVTQELTKVFLIDSSMITDPKVRAQIQNNLEGSTYQPKSFAVEFNSSEKQDLGERANRQAISVVEVRLGQIILDSIRAISEVISLAERLENFSPAELGQPIGYEASATEVAQIANTTGSIYGLISAGIDKAREAKKRIVFESMWAKKEGAIIVDTLTRFTPQTVMAAGFAVAEDEAPDSEGARRLTVRGEARKLGYSFLFNSRDGTERINDVQQAQVLLQFAQAFMNNPALMQDLGKRKVYAHFNEISRLLGSDLRWELEDGEDDSFGVDKVEAMQQWLQSDLIPRVEAIQQENAAIKKELGMEQEQAAA